ncbi:hypothetical protein K2173_008561 [Erythroxylum novogranatense]|uniref:LysM domain-containing protein n=1 Tax=Erythroxylum novogranatense TaxID=1862640 RepID=A0AAV8SKL5_9ROSI|nr:hypothetical protein K2173_008561 [Erythroxylum novogranatense]
MGQIINLGQKKKKKKQQLINYLLKNRLMSFSWSKKTMRAYDTRADDASWYIAIVLLGLILLASIRESSNTTSSPNQYSVRGSQLLDRPCDEIYVVGEGETLHTISDKCGDPYIVENNPHIHDPDDVFPGLLIRITPSEPRKMLR